MKTKKKGSGFDHRTAKGPCERSSAQRRADRLRRGLRKKR